MPVLSRKGFIGNLCRNMEGRYKGLRVRETSVLNIGGFPFRPPQAHAVGGGLVVGKKQRKFWCSISRGSGLVVTQGRAPEFVKCVHGAVWLSPDAQRSLWLRRS